MDQSTSAVAQGIIVNLRHLAPPAHQLSNPLSQRGPPPPNSQARISMFFGILQRRQRLLDGYTRPISLFWHQMLAIPPAHDSRAQRPACPKRHSPILQVSMPSNLRRWAARQRHLTHTADTSSKKTELRQSGCPCHVVPSRRKLTNFLLTEEINEACDRCEGSHDQRNEVLVNGNRY